MRGAGQKGQRGGERRSSRGPTLKYGLLNATTVPTNIPCPLNCFEKDAPILMPWISLPPLESFLASVGLVPFGGFIWVTNSVSGGKARMGVRQLSTLTTIGTFLQSICLNLLRMVRF